MKKVKIFDEPHEKDLENAINGFISSLDGDIIDIQFSTSVAVFADDQLYCFSALITYESD